MREACGYGCVICGLPLYEYDHIIEQAIGGPDTVDNLALLCPTHHAERGGLLRPDDVRAAREDPINLRQGATSPWMLRYGPNPLTISIGGNVFESSRPFIVLTIDDLIPMHVSADQGGRVLLNALFLDEYNEPVLSIDDNELTHRVDGLDFEIKMRRPPVPPGKGARLIIRPKPGLILLELEFVPPHLLLVNRGQILANGVRVRVADDHVNIAGTGLAGVHFSGMAHCIHVGRNIPGMNPAVRIEPVNRYRR